MSRAWLPGQAVLIVVLTGLVVVSGMAAVGSPAVAGQQAATQAGADATASGERLNRSATNRSSHTFDAGWNMQWANSANTNYINTTGPTNPITVRWTFGSDANTFSAGPVVTNGTVYFGTRYYAEQEGQPDGKFYAVDAWTGEVRWTFTKLSDQQVRSIAVLRDTVYVGTGDEKVHALDAATGDVHWSFRTNGPVGNLKVANRTLYVVGKGRVYALGGLRGEEKWAFKTPPGGGKANDVTVKGGTVYTSSRQGHVYALDAQTGAINWDANVNKDGVGRIVVANNHVYAIRGPPLVALDAETGEQSWTWTDPDGHAVRRVAVRGDTVYFYTKGKGGALHAVNATTGADRWSEPDLRRSPVLLDDIGYVRSGKTLHTLDPATGAHHGRFTPPPFNNSWDRWHSGTAVLNGSLYTGVGIDEPNARHRSDHVIFYALGTPEFNYTALSITPRSPDVNESVTATVTVRNTGTGPGTVNATLAVNGNVTNATTARLAPRTNKTVTLTHTFQQNGTYTVAVANLTRTITVGDVEAAPTPTAPPQDDSGSPTQTEPSEETATAAGSDTTPRAAATPTPTSGTVPGFGVGVAVGAVAVVVGVLGRRLWN